ncbi:helix-turn-helix domain-containing protein [Actinomadura harenae]|uniref:XRE family transcriptional regulator n=1 Tax=Actinomadura harenae TaxID=2483351 RepID=A0A3M2MCF0_9ACTN|nr:helix-turn-helix transcriptional regulator [Actinomadura harenae]RMI47404.1 XRE family transcriptional regulator [Actinomadura harenae]
MPNASGREPMVQRAILMGELQRLRLASGQSQEQVAAALDWSASKVIRIESGAVGLSMTDLRALLLHYGVSADDERADAFTVLARDARQPGWWSLYQRALSPGYRQYIGYESGASGLCGFRALLMPGLLQTEEYADALTRELVASDTDREVLVEVRMRRQDEIFGRDDPPRLTMIVDEAVLRRHVGVRSDPGIMPRQLRRILDLHDQSLACVRVIPFSAGAHFGMAGDFTILRFDDARLDDVLCQETVGGTSLTVTDGGVRVAQHRAAFKRLRQIALPAGHTPTFIEKIIASL